MPIDRFFIDAEFNEKAELCLDGSEFHHLAHVARTREKENIELVNGHGDFAEATLAKIEKKKAVLIVCRVEKTPPPSFRSILVQAIPRGSRLDFIIEKGTELGMAELWLFQGEKSEKGKMISNHSSRHQALAISAMKQCGRLFLPEIKYLPPIKEWDSFPRHSYFGDLSSSAPSFFQELLKNPPANEMAFFIGPESGFSQDEIRILKEKGAKGVSLNRNILRTDTAALAALAITEQFALYIQGLHPIPSPV